MSVHIIRIRINSFTNFLAIEIIRKIIIVSQKCKLKNIKLRYWVHF